MKHTLLLTLLLPILCHATVWKVGPTKTYTFCSQVAPLVNNGDTIEIDNATYTNDPQVQWNKNNLYITGVGGRPKLVAGSIIANDAVNGKGIFVISGANVHVHNIEFMNAVVIDNNGAGIRQEGPNIVVANCKFTSNEMGILCGAIPNCKTTIEYCEFINGGSTFNPGYQHNIYIGHIDTFLCRYNYSHDAIAEGHELKSRAEYNFILYNRIANEVSIDSRTIDLPNGGTTVLVGNIIEQGVNSANSNLFGYGLEGLTNTAPHRVWIANNTFINKKATGSFINIATGTDTLFIKNNIIAGAKTGGLIIGTATTLDSSNNIVDNVIANIGFINAPTYDYHLMQNSVAKNAGILLTKNVKGYSLKPTNEYVDTCNTSTRCNAETIDIGAYEKCFPTTTHNIQNASIQLYPNPSNGLLHSNEIIQHLEIRTITGSIIYQSKNPSTTFTVDIPNGIYIAYMYNGKNTSVVKLDIRR